MEQENIHYHTSGFLKDAAYTAELLNTLSVYKDEFGDAESLVLNLDEIPPGRIDYSKKETVAFSEDGKNVTINLTSQKYTNPKGKVTGTPDPYSVYQTIIFVLKRAVKEYAEKFPNNQENE